jgi:hypothetical protein
MGKKREKGKARRAKAAAAQLAATQQTPFNTRASAQHAIVESKRWRGWAMVGLTQGCNHGCPLLPAPDHVVSLFMDDLSDRFILDKFDNYRQVWDDDATRKMALNIMVSIGTNCVILDTDDIRNNNSLNYFAIRLAITIAVMEQYNGNGKDGFALAIQQASLVADDLRCGGKREIIRFFLKRISCTCLKAKYSLIKKSQPTRICECFTCKQVKVRSSMMLCGRCKVRQYCCEECQASDWPNHKTICRSIHERIMK